VCDLYALADAAATPALAEASSALVAYRADPSAGNELLLKAAYNALVSAWETFNQVNGTPKN